MFNRLFGLPAHPLIVHAAVVFVPLLVLVTLGYALVPRLRGKLDWAVVALAVAAPLAVFAARESGGNLENDLFGGGQVPAEVMKHQHYAGLLLIFTIVLGVLALAMVAVHEGKRREKFTVHAVVPLLVTVLAVAAVIPAGTYVYLTGDAGAKAAWGTTK